jgi:DNA-directed RNA polymerase II subunit RPB1
MSDIYHAIISRFNQDSQDISCIFSDDNSTNLILRIQCITNVIEETEDCDQEDTICILKTLEKTILNDIILTGVKNITGATMTPENYFKVWNQETQDFQTRTKWVISTEGTNLEDILCHPAVDPYKTISNDINEIYEVLGLEAARSVLCSEIFSVFETSSAYVNHRHINLLADIMTNRGYLMSVDRHGINKSDNGPLAKCSFEETPDIIARAAIFGQLDKLKSVSSNIMLGQEVPIGTGSVELLFDEEKYIETVASMPTIAEEEKQVSISEKDIFASRYCEALF